MLASGFFFPFGDLDNFSDANWPHSQQSPKMCSAHCTDAYRCCDSHHVDPTLSGATRSCSADGMAWECHRPFSHWRYGVTQLVFMQNGIVSSSLSFSLSLSLSLSLTCALISETIERHRWRHSAREGKEGEGQKGARQCKTTPKNDSTRHGEKTGNGSSSSVRGMQRADSAPLPNDDIPKGFEQHVFTSQCKQSMIRLRCVFSQPQSPCQTVHETTVE